ncbi:MAG: thiol peroxidase [Flavobacteriales bacterium]|nr:thiol peroxidase [Flavobacteriales bacterium]
MATINLGDHQIKTAGNLPAVGTKAPSFVLTGTDLADMQLSDFTGKRLVLNIFPSIDTGTCAASARRFNQEASSLENTVVLNVSKDLPFAQKRFCAAEGLENVLNGSEFKSTSFSENYGVTMQEGRLAGLFSRAVVVIDGAGNVLYTEQVPSIGQEPDYEAAISSL